VILGPGESHAHYSARGSEMFFKATAELDGGDLSLMERTLPPGGRRPPARRHTNCSEAYFVLDGAGLDHRRGRGSHRRARGVRAGPAGSRPIRSTGLLACLATERGPGTGEPVSRSDRRVRARYRPLPCARTL